MNRSVSDTITRHRLLIALFVLVTASASAAAKVIVPAPIGARRGDTHYTLHGVTIADPYRWLEDGKSAETTRWWQRQHKRTKTVLDQIPARAQIVKELRRLLNYTSESVPRVRGKRYLFYRKEGLKNQPILYMRIGSPTAPPKLVLDPNTMSRDGTVAIQRVSLSPDGRLMAYATAKKGSDWSMIRVLDLTTMRHLPDTIDRTRWPSIIWNHTNTGFFYIRMPPRGSVAKSDEGYYRRLFFHRLGDSATADRFVFGEGRPKEEWVGAYASSRHDYLLVETSLDWAKNDLFLRKIDGRGPFIAVAQGLDGRTDADVVGDKLVIFTTHGAPRGQIMVAPLATPQRKYWKTLIPQQTGVITGFSVVGTRLLVQLTENVTSRLLIYALSGKRIAEVPLPTKGTVSAVSGSPESTTFYFGFGSWVYPSTVFSYDVATQRLARVFTPRIPLKPERYRTEQVFYRSKDGTRVPMFLVYRRGLKRNGNNPVELYAYGGFNISIKPAFVARAIPWLDRGGILAVANIRGGGEFGDKWHRAGRRGKKQNVFDDFIAAAEWLIAQRYTRAGRLAIRGGSNGGLLVAAVMTQRPELFGAVICAVPLTDMIRYPISTIARLWMKEYGNPSIKGEFSWLWAYSPYHRIKPGTRYPVTLVMTADHDDRVDPFHARKFAARLQAAITKDRAVLLRVERKAGHGAGTPLLKQINAAADRYAFLIWALGMKLR